MSILKALDGLLAENPACILAAYADLSTGMVLGVRARTKPPQEDLDALCRQAVELLLKSPAAELAEGAGVGHAVRLAREDTRIFCLADGPDPEAWCCIFPATSDAGAIVPEVLRALKSGAETG